MYSDSINLNLANIEIILQAAVKNKMRYEVTGEIHLFYCASQTERQHKKTATNLAPPLEMCIATFYNIFTLISQNHQAK